MCRITARDFLFTTQHSGADRDQKALATFHTEKSKRPPKFLQKIPFLTICMGDFKSPCDQHRIATIASPPLTALEGSNLPTHPTNQRNGSTPNHEKNYQNKKLIVFK
jgi:hypothetical protein